MLNVKNLVINTAEVRMEAEQPMRDIQRHTRNMRIAVTFVVQREIRAHALIH